MRRKSLSYWVLITQNRAKLLQENKLRYQFKRDIMNLSSMDNMSDRLLNECKTGYVEFKML